jgi:hypothetical protein
MLRKLVGRSGDKIGFVLSESPRAFSLSIQLLEAPYCQLSAGSRQPLVTIECAQARQHL